MENIKQNDITRNKNIDLIKGLAIFLVVLGHTYNPYCHDFIYLFHIAIFYIVSGFCHNRNYSNSIESIGLLFKKRIVSLWVPFMAYNFVFLCAHNLLIKIGFLTTDPNYLNLHSYLKDGYTDYLSLYSFFASLFKEVFFSSSRPFVGGLWFLGGLFYVTFFHVFIDFFLKKIGKEKYHLIISALLLVVGFVLYEKYPFLKHICMILETEVLFSLGVLLREKERSVLFGGSHYIMFVVYFIILFCLSRFGTISIASVSIVNPVFFLVVSLCGFFLLWHFSEILCHNNAISNFVNYVGIHTIPILALHTFMFKLITLIQIYVYSADWIMLSMNPVWKNNWFWCIGYVLVGFTIPLVIARCFSKIRPLKFLFKF